MQTESLSIHIFHFGYSANMKTPQELLLLDNVLDTSSTLEDLEKWIGVPLDDLIRELKACEEPMEFEQDEPLDLSLKPLDLTTGPRK